MGREVDDAGPFRVAQQRQCCTYAAHHAHQAGVERVLPLAVGQLFEVARGARADRVDQRVELTPTVADLGESLLDLGAVRGVGDDPDRLRRSQPTQLRCGSIEYVPGPS